MLTTAFKRTPLLLCALFAATLVAAAAPRRAQAVRDQCAGLNKEVTPKALASIIEKYRRGEPVADGLFACRKAFPTVVKYALDPDPKVRERMAFFLDRHYSPAALQALVRQLEAYPADPSGFPAAYAARYPCYFFAKVKAPTLAAALTARIKSRDSGFKRDEIHLLGCLSVRDPLARATLVEMTRPDFPVRLSDEDRVVFRWRGTYARAEAGLPDAEAAVLNDIDMRAQSGDPEQISLALEDLKQFTNCRITLRYAQFITDKRPGRGGGRVADEAVLRFASVYGAKAVGIDERDFRQERRYTDAELETIYRRVKKALETGKFGKCRPPG